MASGGLTREEAAAVAKLRPWLRHRIDCAAALYFGGLGLHLCTCGLADALIAASRDLSSRDRGLGDDELAEVLTQALLYVDTARQVAAADGHGLSELAAADTQAHIAALIDRLTSREDRQDQEKTGHASSCGYDGEFVRCTCGFFRRQDQEAGNG